MSFATPEVLRIDTQITRDSEYYSVLSFPHRYHLEKQMRPALKAALFVGGFALVLFCMIFSQWPLRTQHVPRPLDLDGLAVSILWLIGGLLYFVPTVVAGMRNCKATGGIVVVNIFLGWTFIGWVVALAWAASGERSQKSPIPGP